MRPYLTASVFALLALSPAAGQTTAAKPPPPVDPAAMAVLEKMGAYLRSLPAFEVKATTARDEVEEDGQKIKIGGFYDMTVKKPDKLRASIATDRTSREIVFDGLTFTMTAPKLHYYGSFSSPGTLAEMAEKVSAERGIDLPLADAFYWGTDKADTNKIQSATIVTEAADSFDGCTHLAFQQSDVDWQLWVRGDDKPLPCRLVITSKDDATRPEYTASFAWDTAVTPNDDDFRFTPPAGFARIDFQKTGTPVAQK